MRGDRFRLSDILDACKVIQSYTPESRTEFDANPPLRSHILFHIQIIGEAAQKYPWNCANNIHKFPGEQSRKCGTLLPTSILV